MSCPHRLQKWTVALAAIAAAWSVGIWAQPPLVMESEPNNTPQEALAVSGIATLAGTLLGSDQDAYLWTVSDDDARKRWTFELHGAPGRLTIVEIVRVEYTEDGSGVEAAERLMKMGTRDGLKPSIHQDLLFEPGDYLLGVAAAGGGEGGIFRPPTATLSFGADDPPPAAPGDLPGAYRLIIRQGTNLPTLSKPSSKATRDAAAPMRLGRERGGLTLEQLSWYRFDFDQNAAQSKWDIVVQAPIGRPAQAALVDEAGQTLSKGSTDPRGKLLFPDLTPPTGSWWLKLEKLAQDGHLLIAGSKAVGTIVEGHEAEPNGSQELANRIDLVAGVEASVNQKGDYDYFRFQVDQDIADKVQTITLHNASGHRLELCLVTHHNAQLQCRKGDADIHLEDLVLTQGDWWLSVFRGTEGTDYRLSMTASGAINPGVEAEPNDAAKIASTVPARNRVKGRFGGTREDSDYFRLLVADEPQLWRIQVIGEGIQEVGYLDASGHQTLRVRPPGGQRRVRLDNLYLLPGVHHVQVRGKGGGSYTLLARPQGQPDPNGEIEPNDDHRYMQPLHIGQTRTGLLAEKDDADYYRFFLANEDHVRLTITPPPDGAILSSLTWYYDPFKQTPTPKTGEPIVLEGVLPPGDYQLRLTPHQLSEAEYQVSLERLPRFSCSTDCEPNDNAAFANPLPSNLVVEGVAGDWRDMDYYALPVRAEDTPWTFKATPRREIRIGRSWADSVKPEWDGENEAYRMTVPGGEQHNLIVSARANEPYRIEASFPGANPRYPPTAANLAAELKLDYSTVAAYRRNAQRLLGELRISNASQEPRTLQIDVATSDYRWKLQPARNSVTLAAGEEASVPIAVLAPADAWADTGVALSARVLGEKGHQAETSANIRAAHDAQPVSPEWGWAIPEPLRGSVNVAATALGSELVGEYGSDLGTGFEFLFNGIDVVGIGLSLRGGWQKQAPHREVVIRLAGEEAVEVVGAAFNLFHRRNPYPRLRELDMALSEDGVNFVPVLNDTLEPINTEQYFVLEEPMRARYARLRLKETFSGDLGDQVSLSEWKVLARPGTDVSGGNGLNLASPALGGHVVFSKPTVSVHWDNSLLKEEREDKSINLQAGQDYEMVLAMHHNRAAQITSLEWVSQEDADPSRRFTEVSVAASMDSPHGPWQKLGVIPVSRELNFNQLRLQQPTWARFLRFSAPGQPVRNAPMAPERINVLERPSDDNYRSIHSEWGYASQVAYYESTQPMPMDIPLQRAGNDSRAKAAPLGSGNTVSGAVALGRHEHWYRIDTSAGQNTLKIDLGGDPTVRTSLRLEDSAGDEVALRSIAAANTPRRHLLEATLEPGNSYYLKVEEPPRNVIFSWDTSPSVNRYIPTIYNALVAFSEDVVPGRDAVNLLPYGNSPLLRDWYGESYILQTVLNDYPRRDSSSDAERTLKTASRALQSIPGTKAIVNITDADTTRDAAVWNAFAEVRPRVFSIGVAGGYNADEHQDLLQDWKDVNAGHYKHMNYDVEMDVAFDRAATLLRRPAGYTLFVELEHVEDPGPGNLLVELPQGAGGEVRYAGAVELILDASGSMLKRLDGKRRINIAKEVLTAAVREHIPEGTPTALRVFGHKEVDSCRTDLEVSLQPLDANAMAARIQRIQAMNLARTPIADSLSQVPSDLRQASASSTIVLLTDGEETCDGDPAKVIEKLRSQKFDVTLNIVGFAIGDAELEAQFTEWAEAGGGRYFSAGDQQGLRGAISAALQIPFRVYNPDGTHVGEGLVGGDPLALPGGTYRVVVESNPAQTFNEVVVPGGKTEILTLK